jgi:hypothetical protein
MLPLIGVRSHAMFRVEARPANISDPPSGSRSVDSKLWYGATDVEKTSPRGHAAFMRGKDKVCWPVTFEAHGTNILLTVMIISRCGLSGPQIG